MTNEIEEINSFYQRADKIKEDIDDLISDVLASQRQKENKVKIGIKG